MLSDSQSTSDAHFCSTQNNTILLIFFEGGANNTERNVCNVWCYERSGLWLLLWTSPAFCGGRGGGGGGGVSQSFSVDVPQCLQCGSRALGA